MTAAEYQARYGKGDKPVRAKPEKKVQSAREQMDLSQTLEEEILDGIVIKVGDVIGYGKDAHEIRYQGQDFILKLERL